MLNEVKTEQLVARRAPASRGAISPFYPAVDKKQPGPKAGVPVRRPETAGQRLRFHDTIRVKRRSADRSPGRGIGTTTRNEESV